MMTSEHFERLNSAFHAALDVPSDRRHAFVRELFSEEDQLAREMHQLLRIADDDTDNRLAAPLRSSVRNAIDPESTPQKQETQLAQATFPASTRIGPFRLERLLGSGGGGAVYLAEREGDFRQQVAIKLMHQSESLSDAALRRFDFERQLLSQLQHNNIARLFDGGRTTEGQPYFVMEYVAGQTITEYCTSHRLSIQQILRLFLQVCNSVGYAHRLGVIHRDLKPSNILVTEDGVVKLVDFGIAKLTAGHRAADAPPITETSIAPMTPQYASPEQISNNSITTSSDVYSLGVVLYEILAGVKPYQASFPNPTQLKAIMDTDPLRPSAAVAKSVDSNERNTVESRDRQARSRQLRGDVDLIVMTALRKEPSRRYETAQLLADDISNHLAQKPIVARSDSITYVFNRLILRHRAIVMTACCSFIALFVAVIVSTLALLEASRTSDELRDTLYSLKMSAAYNAFNSGDLTQTLATLEEQIPGPGQPDHRGYEWYFLKALCERMQEDPRVFGAETKLIVPRPGHNSVAVVGPDDSLSLVDLATGVKAPIRGRSPAVAGSNINCAEFSHDGRRLAIGCSIGTSSESGPHFVEVLDLTFSTTSTLECSSAVTCVAFSRDGKRCGFGCFNGKSGIWKTTRAEASWLADGLHETDCKAIAFSPDDQHLAVTGQQFLNVWTTSEGKSEFELKIDTLRDVVFSPCGNFLLVAGERLTVIEANNGWTQARHPLAVGMPHLTSIAFSADGKTLVTGNNQGIVELRDFETGEFLERRLHKNAVDRLEFSSNGSQLISISKDIVQNWKFSTESDAGTEQTELRWVDRIAIDPNTNRVACGGRDNKVLVGHITTEGVRFEEFARHDSAIYSLAFSHDGRLLATGSCDEIVDGKRNGTIRVWDVASGHMVQEFKTGSVLALAFSPDNENIIAGEFEGNGATLWNIRTGEDTPWRLPFMHLTSIVLCPQKNLMILGGGQMSAHGRLEFWRYDVDSPQLIEEFESDSYFEGIALSPNQAFLAAGCRSGVVRIYDVERVKELAKLTANNGNIKTVAFCPDSKTLFSGGLDGVKFWDFRRQQAVGEIAYHAVDAARIITRHDGKNGLLVVTGAKTQTSGLGFELNWVE